MKVVILAGDFGTRLAEETIAIPKPMVQIGQHPILWHIMKFYASYGFDEFVVALGYKAEVVKNFFLQFADMASDLTIDLGAGTVERRRRHEETWKIHLIGTGLDTLTGGRVRRLAPLINGETFMLTYGDGVSNVPLDRLVAFHNNHGKLATVTAVPALARFGNIIFDGDRVADFAEKRVSENAWINGGYMVMEPGVFDYLKKDEDVLEVDLLERLSEDGQLGGYRHEGFWQCMDTLRDKQGLEQLWRSGSPPGSGGESAVPGEPSQPKKRPSCRSCGHADLLQVLSLGRVPLANALLTAEQLRLGEDRFPLELYFCPQCALVQIGETVPPERLFRDYIYASSFSDTMVEHARTLAEALIDRHALGPANLIIEIASNDGYLLQFYKTRGIPVLGIEPAANIAELAIKKGISTLIEFFDEDLGRRLAAQGKLADIIHAHNVFAHVPDPNTFVGGIKQALKPDGVAVIEAPYVRDLIVKLEFDTIYHEHFSYYSVSSVEALCRHHGLMICDVELVPIHGGSLRLFVAHAGRQASERVVELLGKEKAEGLLTFGYYRDFADRVAGLKQQLLALLQRLQDEGHRIAAYGASAKGSTLMNAFGIDRRLIEFVVDRSHLKQGRFTPGNHLPILPPEALLERRPDYVLLLTWNFADEILAQQGEFRRRGGKFIVPIPEVTVI